VSISKINGTKSSPKTALVVSGVHVVRDGEDSSFILALW